MEKQNAGKIESEIILPESLAAPVENGQQVGEIIYTLDGSELARIPICAAENAERITFGQVFLQLLNSFLYLKLQPGTVPPAVGLSIIYSDAEKKPVKHSVERKCCRLVIK